MPFPESRRIHPGRESRAVSTSVAKDLKNFFLVAPSKCWYGKSRRLHVDPESRAVFIAVWKVWKWLSFITPYSAFPEQQCRAVSALVAKVAPEFFGCENLEMANLGRENRDIPNMSCVVLIAPPPLRSRKSRLIIMVAKVWICLTLVCKVWTSQLFVAKVWT